MKFERHSSNVAFEEFGLSGLVVVDPFFCLVDPDVKDRFSLTQDYQGNYLNLPV